MSRNDDKIGKNVASGGNGLVDWDEEKVFRKEGGSPETLRESLEAKLELERQRSLRTMADFENYRRRVSKERETLVLYSNEKLLKEFLPVIDDLERAVALAEAGGDEQTLDSFVQGVRLILGRIVGVLERAGVKAFDSVGEPFDPTHHEAVMLRLDEDAPASSVLEVLEKGYMLYARLLRPTKAVVNALRAPRPVPQPDPPPEAQEPSAEPAEGPSSKPEETVAAEDSGSDFDFSDEDGAEDEFTDEVVAELPAEAPLEAPLGEPLEEPKEAAVTEELISAEDTGEDLSEPGDEHELTGGAFEIDEDALGSLDDWEKEFSD